MSEAPVTHIIRQYVEHLRDRDERAKRRWIIQAAIVSIISIIALWIFYLNLALPRVYESPAKSTETAKKPAFLGVFARGITALSHDIGDDLKQMTRSLGIVMEKGVEKSRHMFKWQREFSFGAEEERFVFEQEPVPSTLLPQEEQLPNAF